MNKHERFLTIVEGRDNNQKMMAQLVSAAERMGWATRLVKSFGVLDVTDNNLDKIFTEFVLWRGPVGNDIYEQERVVAWLNRTDRVTVNTLAMGSLSCASNKFYQHGVMKTNPELARHILPMYEAKGRQRLEALMKAGRIDYPFVLKPMFGSQGYGIRLIRGPEDLDDIQNYNNLAVEPYMASRYDWRVFVIGGEAVGVMKKIGNEADEGDFVAKSAGRKRFKEESMAMELEASELAVLAAAAMNFDYAGVDLIQDDETGEFYVLETNFAGGWQNGFKEATGVDIPTEIIKYFEKKYQERLESGN